MWKKTHHLLNMEIKVKDKCIVCDSLLSFSIREKSLMIPGGQSYWIGKIPVTECRNCHEVYEDEITVRDYKIKILNQMLDRFRKDVSFNFSGHTCFWVRQSILLSREELAEYKDEKAIKATEQLNEPLSPVLATRLGFFIEKFLSKQMALNLK